ncbi:MAG: hypothetical protein FWD85_04075 [Microbacteriaceae bacterium]|nr:hypothetical protein [Microbacteriaceae bacterium]MCL2794465.1 hypothetical protein [Microbacteriaceae bacterium]
MPRKNWGAHTQLAAELRTRADQTGVLDAELRRQLLARDLGHTDASEPYAVLARQIDADSSRVTDEQVAAVLELADSQQKAFEVVLTAAIGAGLRRWDVARDAIEGAADASS